MLALIIFQRMLSKTAWDSVAAQNLHSLNGEFFFPGLESGVCCHFLVLEQAPLSLRLHPGYFIK